MDQIKPTTLVHGSDTISRYLRYCMIPFGVAYKFESTSPCRPKPLPILVVLLSFMPLVFVTLIHIIVLLLVPESDEQSDNYKAIAASVFISRLSKVARIYRIIMMLAIMFITLSQHGCISNVLASGNNYLTEKEQARYAKMTFAFFCLNIILNTLAYPTVFMFVSNEQFGHPPQFYILLIMISGLIFWIRLSECTSLIFSCYLGASLGRHVENFSTIYIDTMFDQFMLAIEKEADQSWLGAQMRSLPFFDSDSSAGPSASEQDGKTNKSTGCRSGPGVGHTIWRHLVTLLTVVYNFFRSTIIRLSLRRYPELPEMKMTKLSSTTQIQISETTRMANNHLIRVRLRRTQIMLSDLRDLVSDINKTSSPIVLMYLIFETMFIVIITTASVQAKVYKSISVLILPTISVTISLASFVVYVCVCYDETAKQLKLLINKLFDFIIMNHRVQSRGKQSDRKRSHPPVDGDQVCILPGSEMGAINETWSQFQYTRKLANTIQFTMGGIMPVTRRLVLSILGHILSAVFISIEIMSIIDTMNTPHGASHSNAINATHGHKHNTTSSGHHRSMRLLELA